MFVQGQRSAMFVQGQRSAMFLWQCSSKVVAMFLYGRGNVPAVRRFLQIVATEK